jgi:protein-L-isoaspartate(D-aspartate) O-methyltransferase
MDRQSELSIIRAAYAKQTLAAATFFETTMHLGMSARAGVVDNVRLEAALSVTRREDFLGAGCVYQKLKPGRSGDGVRLGSGTI